MNAIFTRTENFDIRVEYSEDFVIVHFARLDKITKGVLIDLQLYLEDFYEFITTAGYMGVHAAVDVANTVVNRLVVKLQFQYVGMADGHRVYQYQRNK